MRDPDLTTLRLFVIVCEERSISRAAERASIAGSAISKRIRSLEQQWGTALLTRRRYGVEPTQAGETLLGHARNLLATSQRIERDMHQHTRGVVGQVRLLASVSMLKESLVSDISAFLGDPAHRDIQVDIEEALSPELAQQVRDGQATLGVVWDAANLRDLEVAPYANDQFSVVVPVGHQLAGQDSIRFAETLDFPYVGMPAASIIHSVMSKAAAAAGRLLNSRIVMRNHEATLHAVESGLAIALIPHGIASRYAEHGTVSVIYLDEPWAHRSFVVCHKPAQWLSPAAQALLNFLTSAHPQSGA